MTLMIKLTNPDGNPHTAIVRKVDVDDNGVLADVNEPATELAAGESTTVTLWKGRSVLLAEKD